MTDDLRARVHDVLPGMLTDLKDLVRIESVSADPARHDKSPGFPAQDTSRPARARG
jgi:hypothetical protein